MESINQVPGPYEDTTCQMVMAYGDPKHSHLKTVREFRDSILKSNKVGRKLIDFYYTTAPFAVSAISGSRLLKALTLYTFAYPSYLVSRAALGISKHF